MNNRLQQFLELENITPARLADILGVQRSGLSHILSGRNKPGFEFITKLLTKFPRINSEWLILGKGKPYKDMNGETSASPLPSEKNQRANSYDSIQSTILQYDSILSNDVQYNSEQYCDSPDFEQNGAFIPEFDNGNTNINTPQVSDNVLINTKNNASEPAENRVNGQNKGVVGRKKSIKRVIVFYSDGSFEELFPHIR